MTRLKLLLFALDAAGRAGLDRAGASFAGGDLRRNRSVAYRMLAETACDAILQQE
ncbi:MAG: hypothetical protein AAGF88_07320 [Pseudomonadota bacterium]